MSYEQFGNDAAALLRALNVERADVMGYSHAGTSVEKAFMEHDHDTWRAALDDLRELARLS
jgi:hypothetical protein